MKSPEICPYCSLDVTNGVGPSDCEIVTKLLHNLPSSHLFYDAANYHDLAYHIGSDEQDRKKADEIFLENMLRTVSIYCCGFYAIMYTMAAYRNYYAVRLFGKRFFNYAGCKGKTEKKTG